MLVQSLLGEFLHEAENTRKLLKAIPDSALSFKPSPTSWTTAELASHIAEIYNWYTGTFQDNVFDISKYEYDNVDLSKAENIVQKFERAFEKAKNSLASATDESLAETWTMVGNGQTYIPEMPRIQVLRGFLMNHVYHHRGEMIIYLRSTGNKVPGMYGPTYEESN
jgi:uncharacterized damage-inducible protein DinB